MLYNAVVKDWKMSVLGKIIFEMISNQNQNHESLIDLKS